MSKWHAAHYNALAKEIREGFHTYWTNGYSYGNTQVIKSRFDKQMSLARNGALTDLALRLAKRFAEDNPKFDPLKFLDACSPDKDLLPLSELWEEDDSEDS